MASLEKGEIDNTPLNTELPKQTRKKVESLKESTSNDPIVINKTIIASILNVLFEVCSNMKNQLEKRISCPTLISLIKKAFNDWNEDSLDRLIDLSIKSGRDYGQKDILMKEYLNLKERFLAKEWLCEKEEDRWLHVCKHEHFFLGCENILHFALCCFIKSPVESIVESVGSTINRHGNKHRASLTLNSLTDEINVAWNGPEEFSADAKAIIKNAIHSYFHNSSIHFYTHGTSSSYSSFTTSKTVMNLINKKSRISREEF